MGEAYTAPWELVEHKGFELSDKQLEGLREAILADCEEMTLVQDNTFHTGTPTYLHIEYTGESGRTWGLSIRVYQDSRHTMAWIKENFNKVEPY